MPILSGRTGGDFIKADKKTYFVIILKLTAFYCYCLVVSRLQRLNVLAAELNDIIGINYEGRKSLDLGRRRLLNIPRNVLQLRSLIVLDLSHNCIRQLPDDMSGLKHLTKLTLSHNKLELLANSIGDLVNLVQLFVNNNGLRYLPAALKQLKKLRELDVSFNKLTELSMVLADLKGLKRLCVEGNPLTSKELRSLMKLMDKMPNFVIDIAGEFKVTMESMNEF